MKILNFFKDRIYIIFMVVFIMIIVNNVLALDPNFSKSKGTLIYMNVLVLIATLGFFFIGYYRYNNKINRVIEAINNIYNENENFEDDYLYNEVKKIIEQNKEEVISLRKELEEINDYLTKWVHEVKIPIAVLQIIAKRVDEIDNTRELSKQINTELSRIEKLVEQAMYSSRVGSYSSDFLINEVNLEKVVKEVVKKNKYQFIYNKIDLNIGNLNQNILTDKIWISHIIELIIDNAVKYSDEGGKIDIFLEEDKESIKLHIKDYGMGIEQQDIDRIFDKGFTGVNGRKRTKSTGMGLYISKKILNKLSHDINVVSVANEFCDVSITFYKLSDYFNIT